MLMKKIKKNEINSNNMKNLHFFYLWVALCLTFACDGWNPDVNDKKKLRRERVF